ncbi:MAG: hypothetical protein WD080_03625 [Egibacteraceae bacterium]
MSRSWAGVAVCLALAACTGDDGGAADRAGDEPPAEPLTTEEYVAASHDACEHYLGALFGLVEADEQIDLDSPDASTEVFRRRATDIAGLHADYRTRLDELEPPEDLRSVHDELVALQGEHVETLQALGGAHQAGDDERAEALVADSARIETETAALQSRLGVQPCGQ